MGDLYDKPSVRAAIDCLRQRFPAAVSTSDEAPVFILAAGWRSGSTLLQRMIMPTCFVWGEPYGHSGLVDTLADQVRGFTDSLPEPHFFFDGASAEELSQRFIANLYPAPEHLLAAHLQYFQALFIDPLARGEPARWGIKEVRLTADHAFYLRWLYPRAKFLFLYRNPYDCFRSFASRRNAGWKWYHRWPDHLLTVSSFGKHWRVLVESFLQHSEELGGLLVKFEDLAAGRVEPIEDYLDFKLSKDAAEVRPDDGPPPLETISPPELAELNNEVAERAAALGYRDPDAEKPGAVSVRVGESLDPKRCVVLVPVGSHIEPACESALTELQNRGYPVWRIRGYAAIDQGRNQMATDALSQGFAETMWIDSDVAFNPDDIDKLRAHQLPIVCGIYPQKGKRALACHVMPGTAKLTFGENGGLTEILYGATGFLHVRRPVYETMQTRLELPLCNERFGKRPMIPYFQPLVRPDGDGHWYLAEDYSFSERARRCGYRIMADTTIRLRHIGSYGYSWEDAGGDTQRFATFHYHLGHDPARTPKEPESLAPIEPIRGEEFDRRLAELARAFAWPAEKPDVEPQPNAGWLLPATREMLKRVISGEHRLIVELGPFAGLSTRFIADLAPKAKVATIDHWQGSAEHYQNPEVAPLLPDLHETFLVNCWDYRDRIIPLRMHTLDGLREIARRGLHPDVIFIDSDHSYDAVKADVTTSLKLFPSALIVGDDWKWESVRRAVTAVANQREREIEAEGNAWRLM